MFLNPYQELIWVYICDEVNTLEESNSLGPPIMFSDIPMLLGMFRFYALWIPFFEIQMLLWQILLKQGHGEGAREEFQSYIICVIFNEK